MRARLSVAVLTIILASAAAAADRTGVSDETIRIGLFGPVSGPASIAAKTVYRAAAIYKDVNDRGGISGRKLELVIEDDGCDSIGKITS